MQPFRYIPRVGFRSSAISGRRWALLPSAAGFVDPLLSTGFPLTLLGVARLAEILESHWKTERFSTRLAAYAEKTEAELLATAQLIGALYANFGNFRVFSALTLLYFAAASYAESARRLGRPQLASSFLLYDQPQFGTQSAAVLQRALAVRLGTESHALIDEIRRVIEPIDVAGLTDRTRRNWYPVDAGDLLRGAHKLGANREDILQMLERCGFNASAVSRG